jgi:transcriptional regulator
MYTPREFEEQRLDVLHDAMRANPFAALVSGGEGGPVATHLPFILDPARGEFGTLRGHMARANRQWRAFAGGDEVLVIFGGAHAYISPSWYETDLAVPTWNYVAVHAYGTPEIIDDHAAALALLRDQVATFEARFEQPWTADGLPGEWLDARARAIVAFEIPIARIEGKAKMSQNRPAEQARVAATLAASGDAMALATANEMRARSQ